MKLELKYLAPYLPYGLKVLFTYGNKIGELTNLYNIREYDDIKLSIDYSDGEHIWMFKPILRPLSDLTKSINWGLQTYEFTSLFEIGDDDGFIYEFDHGNIKLINELESIALYGNYKDLDYLPYPIVQMMIEYHFDIFGLIEAGLAIDINLLDN